jgi:hypothetical protein
MVCKFHNLDKALKTASEPDALFFATFGSWNRTGDGETANRTGEEDAWRPAARALEREWASMSRTALPRRHAPLSYVQTTDAVMRHGYHISLEYQRALNRSDADAMSVLEYIARLLRQPDV